MTDFNRNTGKKPSYTGGKPNISSKTEEAPKDLPADYVKEITDGYFTDSGVLKLNLITKYPKELAALFAKCKIKENGKEKNAVTNKQVRGFYESIVMADTKLSTNQKSIEEVLVDINMHVGHVYNKVKKGILPEVFGKFITLNIEGITSNEDVKAFRKHFEALVCYLPIEK